MDHIGPSSEDSFFVPSLETVSGSGFLTSGCARGRSGWGGGNPGGDPPGDPPGESPGDPRGGALLPTGRDLGRGSVDVREESCIQEGSALTRRYLLRRSADYIGLGLRSACQVHQSSQRHSRQQHISIYPPALCWLRTLFRALGTCSERAERAARAAHAAQCSGHLGGCGCFAGAARNLIFMEQTDSLTD